jgi:predicted Co/Zn/Cd cation transporter (cation efflux family)
MNKLRSIYASAYSAAVTIATVTAMTIGAELSAPFKSWLTGFTGHHWVTKSWISVFVFILFFGIFRLAGKAANESQTKKALFVLETFAILGFLTILGFYAYEFLSH